MGTLAFKATTVVVVLSFSIQSIAGCGGSREAMKQFEEYENRTYTPLMIIHGSSDNVYRASVRALQEKGFVVTLSDPHTGLMNAEMQSPSIIPEDQKAIDDAKDSPSVWAIILGVLAIILVVGLIAILVESCNKNDTDDASSGASKKEEEPGTIYVAPSPAPVATSYRYIVSLTLTPVEPDSTEIDIAATKIVLENGAVQSSIPMHNKYLNYSIFDAIHDRMPSRN